jgi:hypothetical protein
MMCSCVSSNTAWATCANCTSGARRCAKASKSRAPLPALQAQAPHQGPDRSRSRDRALGCALVCRARTCTGR